MDSRTRAHQQKPIEGRCHLLVPIVWIIRRAGANIDLQVRVRTKPSSPQGPSCCRPATTNATKPACTDTCLHLHLHLPMLLTADQDPLQL
jgi:hypothetical protein